MIPASDDKHIIMPDSSRVLMTGTIECNDSFIYKWNSLDSRQMVHLKKCAHDLSFIVVWFKWILPISLRVTSLALGQSYDCPSAREVTLKDIVKKIISIWINQELWYMITKLTNPCAYGIYYKCSHRHQSLRFYPSNKQTQQIEPEVFSIGYSGCTGMFLRIWGVK